MLNPEGVELDVAGAGGADPTVLETEGISDALEVLDVLGLAGTSQYVGVAGWISATGAEGEVSSMFAKLSFKEMVVAATAGVMSLMMKLPGWMPGLSGGTYDLVRVLLPTRVRLLPRDIWAGTGGGTATTAASAVAMV